MFIKQFLIKIIKNSQTTKINYKIKKKLIHLNKILKENIIKVKKRKKKNTKMKKKNLKHFQ